MNNIDFFEAIGLIDEEYIIEVKKYRSSKINIRKIFFAGGVAVCFALCLLFGRTFNFETANLPDNVIMEKQSASATDYESKQKLDEEKATSNGVMDNLNQYFSEHDFPDWFGDYYLEKDIVYVSLVELNKENRLQVQTWGKSEDIIFKKARFSYNYLNSVFNRISDSIKNEQIGFIGSIWIDSKSNCIKVTVNSEITNEEKQVLYSYDTKWKGGVFDVNLEK